MKPNNFDGILTGILGKYLMERCYSEYYQQLSFQIFCKLILYFKVIIKSVIDPAVKFNRKSKAKMDEELSSRMFETAAGSGLINHSLKK